MSAPEGSDSLLDSTPYSKPLIKFENIDYYRLLLDRFENNGNCT